MDGWVSSPITNENVANELDCCYCLYQKCYLAFLVLVVGFFSPRVYQLVYFRSFQSSSLCTSVRCVIVLPVCVAVIVDYFLSR